MAESVVLSTSIFPIIPKHSYAILRMDNQGANPVQISAISLALKDSPSGKIQKKVDSVAAVELLAGGQHVFNYTFSRKAFCFSPAGQHYP